MEPRIVIIYSCDFCPYFCQKSHECAKLKYVIKPVKGDYIIPAQCPLPTEEEQHWG